MVRNQIKSVSSLDESLDDLLMSAGLNPEEIRKIVENALAEDLRYGPDATTNATVGAKTKASADIVARQDGVLAGVPVAVAVLDAAGVPLDGIKIRRQDGGKIAKGDEVMTITGPLRKILTAERTLLNFITHLSGIATNTRIWVDAVAGTGCMIRDTRKTTPGLRSLEKYAVRCGGGQNHRMGLGDEALIKDNHVIAAGSIKAAIEAVRKTSPDIPMEVECDTVEQVKEALAMNVNLILLDNMSFEDIKAAVASGRDFSTRFEASGGLKLETAQQVAETGVDFLSIGALTHSSPALDLGLDMRQ
jgi:nicotinate-nucleotide pyrophosphorylase (carboxylating)